jgi:hypothetical protein
MQFINLLVSEPAQRRSQDADQRHPVMGIVHGAQQIDRVDDLLSRVKVALAFDHVTNSLAAQRFKVVVDVSELTEQNRDVFRLRIDVFAARVKNRGFA